MIVGKNISNETLGVYDNGVLINNYEIQNQEELTKIERNVSARRLAFLHLLPIEGKFNSEHLCEIHRFIFSSIYPFAGKIREIDLSKPGALFCLAQYVEEYLFETLKKMKEDIKKCQTKEEFIKLISYYYAEIIIIHPFREGNGRAIREFIREYVEKVSEHLPFEACYVDYSRINGEDLLKATIESNKGYYENLEKQFEKALVSKLNKKNNDKTL